VTAHTPPLPLAVGTVKVMAVSDQESTWKAAALPGAPQLIPLSNSVT